MVHQSRRPKSDAEIMTRTRAGGALSAGASVCALSVLAGSLSAAGSELSTFASGVGSSLVVSAFCCSVTDYHAGRETQNLSVVCNHCGEVMRMKHARVPSLRPRRPQQPQRGGQSRWAREYLPPCHRRMQQGSAGEGGKADVNGGSSRNYLIRVDLQPQPAWVRSPPWVSAEPKNT